MEDDAVGGCFTGHCCDWRLPPIGELRGIVGTTQGDCGDGPGEWIDRAVFGPTVADLYRRAALLAPPICSLQLGEGDEEIAAPCGHPCRPIRSDEELEHIGGAEPIIGHARAFDHVATALELRGRARGRSGCAPPVAPREPSTRDSAAAGGHPRPTEACRPCFRGVRSRLPPRPRDRPTASAGPWMVQQPAQRLDGSIFPRFQTAGG